MSSNPPSRPNDLNMQIITSTQRLFHLCPHEWQIRIIQDLVQSHSSNNKTNMLSQANWWRQISSVSSFRIRYERDNIIYDLSTPRSHV